MALASSIYLTSSFSPICISHTHSQSLCGSSRPAAGTSFLHDLHAVQEAVWVRTTQDVWQQRLYKQWTNFCSTLLVNPALVSHSEYHRATRLIHWIWRQYQVNPVVTST